MKATNKGLLQALRLKSETISLTRQVFTQLISTVNRDRNQIFKRKIPTFSGEFEKAYDWFNEIPRHSKLLSMD